MHVLTMALAGRPKGGWPPCMHVLTMALAPHSPQVSKPTEEGDEVDAELSSSVHPSLRGIREHAHLLKCQRVTAERMHELAAVLGASCETAALAAPSGKARDVMGGVCWVGPNVPVP